LPTFGVNNGVYLNATNVTIHFCHKILRKNCHTFLPYIRDKNIYQILTFSLASFEYFSNNLPFVAFQLDAFRKKQPPELEQRDKVT
jgi:hypothetical protein